MMPRKTSSTFVAEPFDGVASSRPDGVHPRAAKPPTLRAPIAARVSHPQVPPTTPKHAPPRSEPWQMIDTTAEPTSVSHAVAMREALKRRISMFTERLRHMHRNDKQRAETIRLLHAAQARSSELAKWVRAVNGAASWTGRSNEALLQAAIDILDRLEEEGAALTEGDRAVMDEASEFIAWANEQYAVKKALREGKVPTPPSDE